MRRRSDTVLTELDIAALHAVVVAAQELLDSAPEPKPLPAAALFKAYDAVLPTYGIDPDSDHHLSTFVFRVGGERGEGSLLDKFQTILHRMGIVLEFGDNTTVSLRTSASTSPAASSLSRQSHAHLQHENGQENDQQNGHLTSEVEAPQSPFSPSASPPSSPLQSPTHSPSPSPPQSPSHSEAQPRQDEIEFSVTDEEDGAYEEMRKAVVSSAMNRWRSLVANRRAQSAQRIPSFPSIPEEASADVRNFEDHPFEEKPAAPTQQTIASPQVNGIESHDHVSAKESTDLLPRPMSAQSFMHRPLSVLNNAIRSTTSLLQGHMPQTGHIDEHSHHENEMPRSPDGDSPHQLKELEVAPSHHSPIQTVPKVHSPTTAAWTNAVSNNGGTIVHHAAPQERTDVASQQQMVEESPSTPDEQSDTEREHSRLLRRATRAREIYLASKVFNHWADRTARRLERDAVARRHMIRFRYFRSWSQAPALREPGTDYMRAAVVVKKWQRIVAMENSLQMTARAAAQAYELKKVGKVLDHWSCHRLEHVGRQKTALRNRTGGILKWLSQASHGEALEHAIRTQTCLRLQVDTIHRWQDHAGKETMLCDTAKRIGDIQHSFTHLREWWDQAEISRRATEYRKQVMMQKANFAFDQWNLRARAQAFQWRREYLQVERAFDRWFQCAEQNEDMSRRAEGYYEEQAKAKVLGGFRRLQRESSHMALMEDRVRLYLGATSVLRVFDRAIKNRKDQDKRHVKKYLMARYTQVSSARKKRNFFAAIDRWRVLAEEDRVQSDLVQELRARKDSHHLITVTDMWMSQTQLDQRRIEEAKLQHAQEWLEAWKVYTSDLEQRDAEAWQLWAADKQRQSLKSWSIASLQQSGQGHTALEVQKKHEREKRNRVLQQWRQRDDRIRTMAPGSRVQSSSAPSAWPRGSWRTIAGRRSMANRNDRVYDYSGTPLETPTRWTGQPFSMSTMLPPGSMAPLREADEGDGAFSLAGDEDDGDLPASPSIRPASRGPGKFSTLPSTTPMAPVPSHLERDGQRDGTSIGATMQHHSRISKLASSQMAPGTPRPVGMPQFSDLNGPEPLQQPPASTRSFGFGPPNGRTARPQPSSPEPNSPAVGSKSVGARSSGTRFGLSRPTTKFTPATRSVRIQSPSQISSTPQTQSVGVSRGHRLRGRTSTSR